MYIVKMAEISQKIFTPFRVIFTSTFFKQIQEVEEHININYIILKNIKIQIFDKIPKSFVQVDYNVYNKKLQSPTTGNDSNEWNS